MIAANQSLLFPNMAVTPNGQARSSSTFADNLRLPVHRWIRYSAGFSAVWAQSVIRDAAARRGTRVFDPFAGSGTTLLAAEDAGVESFGIEAHPFVYRLARAKLFRCADQAYRAKIQMIRACVKDRRPDIAHYPKLIRSCYSDYALERLDMLRRTIEENADGSPAAELAWLTLIGILRKSSRAGTAQWQYVLPKKSKKRPADPFQAFDELSEIIYSDLGGRRDCQGPAARLLQGDARTCADVPDGLANLVVTSPPYPNNYDYADATRLEMCFFGEIRGWADLQSAVRRHLVRSCTQHVPERAVNLRAVLDDPSLAPIREELMEVCQQLADVRLSRGGKKTYHLMVACYFLDLAQVWRSLRRVCDSPSDVCFVIGDSAPYGVYVPVIDWLGRLAVAAGFQSFRFERTRDRNVKWKNRKHRVPLCEGRLWVEG